MQRCCEIVRVVRQRLDIVAFQHDCAGVVLGFSAQLAIVCGDGYLLFFDCDFQSDVELEWLAAGDFDVRSFSYCEARAGLPSLSPFFNRNLFLVMAAIVNTNASPAGTNVRVSIELITPVAMEAQQRFAIREGGKTVGAGVITKIVA